MQIHAATNRNLNELYSALATCSKALPLAATPWAGRLSGLGWPILPALVVTPDSYDTAAKAVQAAASIAAALIPAGGGTHMGWGSAPAHADLLLDLSQLYHIVDYSPVDMYVTVEAGCPFQKLQQELLQHGQHIPIDIATRSDSTVGGIVACDPPNNWSLGTLRDYIIGMRVLQANGDIARSGSKVMKNVAGLELPKLYTGALGTLGIILQVTFKVRPLPSAWGVLALPLPGWAAGETALETILNSELAPFTVQLVHTQDRAFIPPAPEAYPISSGPTLITGFCGVQADVDWQIKHCAGILSRLGVPTAIPTEAWPEWRLWLNSLLTPQGGTGVSLVATVMSSEIAAFCSDAETLCKQNNLAMQIAARASGQASLHISAPDASETALTKLADTVHALQERANAIPGSIPGFREQARGNAIVIHAPQSMRHKLSIWGAKPSALPLMRAIKQQLDPIGLFNPGRFVGGI